MNRIRVMTIFGTRPEAIKMAPLALELSRRPQIDALCCVTAQHRQMLDSVLDIFRLVPDFDLNIMEPRQTLSTITSKCLLGMEEVLEQARPDLVLVHGDTSTTFAGALAAFYHRVPVGHVEAGLRTYDKYSPYPEEMNRRMVSAIADLHFCPTPSNRDNLAREGIEQGVFLTGNTVIDALQTTVVKDFHFSEGVLNDLDYVNRKVILVTCHRRENYGTPMAHIMTALRRVADAFPDVELVYPVHLSPVVQEAAHQYLDGHPRIHLIGRWTMNFYRKNAGILIPSCVGRRSAPRRWPRGRSSWRAPRRSPSSRWPPACSPIRRPMPPWPTPPTPTATAGPAGASLTPSSTASVCGRSPPPPSIPDLCLTPRERSRPWTKKTA